MAKPRQGAHLVAIPYPLQGHIEPMMQLCNILAHNGFSITFVHIESNRFNTALPKPSPHLPINIVFIPDSLPTIKNSSPSQTLARVLATEHLVHAFTQVVLNTLPHVCCILSDALMSWAQSVAAQFALPFAALWTGAASSCLAYCSIPLLASEGYLPMHEFFEQDLITSIPGFPPIFRVTDLPSFFHVRNLPDDLLDFITRQMNNMRKATWVLSNSVSLEFETEAEEALQKEMPFRSIGPLLAISPETALDGNQIGANLVPENEICLEWLKGRPPASVLYISFGSVIVLSAHQIQEIAVGLEASEQAFLWALRPGLMAELGETSVLLGEFRSRTANRGLVISWAPQRQVLAQESVGGFLTHCGWNSVMESIWNGKPMLGLPRFAEQRMNCRLVEKWHVGKGLIEENDGIVGREEVEKQVRAIMVGDEANKGRLRCEELKTAVHKVVSSEGGSSFTNLHSFVTALGDMQPASYC